MVKDLADKFRSLYGDSTFSVPDDFIINAINWAFNALPSVPHLERAFSKHYTETLDANGHYRFLLHIDSRRVSDIKYMYFYTSTGGDPCPLCICNRPNEEFYAKNGLIELKVAGKPCEYTLEREDDDTYLVLDRPSNVPIIVDYIAMGYPKPVESMDEEIEISAPIENLMLAAMRRMAYQEASDFPFAESVTTYLDNKEIVEAIQMLNKTYGCEAPVVLGGGF